MKRMRFLFLLAFSALASCRPSSAVTPDSDVPPAAMAQVYTTSVAGARMEPGEVTMGKPGEANYYKVSLNGKSYQTVDGFGLAITQASCYNLMLMDTGDRTAFLEEVFSREKGLGSSLIRVCIGGSDFSLDEFTWCDQAGMENFDVHELDRKYVFPILDEIYRINPDVKIIGSPWSCPLWMKMGENGSLPYNQWTGGRLNPLHYQEYAQYFVKWIQEMEKRGYQILAVTLQNEPLNRGNSMSLFMPWADQLAFIKEAVGPAFSQAGIKAKILLFDHNYNYDGMSDQSGYPLRILADEEAAAYVAGSAWHSYGGNVSVLDGIHSSAPDKDIYFTEASIGSWNYNFGDCLINDFRDIFIGTLSRYGKGITLWNLMLDDEHKPYRQGGCSTCWGAVTLSSKDHSLKSIVRNSHYYNVAQCSKVLQPGALRLGTSGYTSAGLSYLWFRNPDGSYAVIFLNENSDKMMVNLVTDKVSVPCTIPAKSIQSVLWTE